MKIGEPFHEPVIEYLDDLTESAKRCGSVNCVTVADNRLVGDNTEGAALVELLQQQMNPTGRRAVIVGAGRLARALAIALADAGISAITVASRKEAAGQQLVELIQGQTAAAATFVPLGGNSVALEPDTAVLVNATSLGAAKPEAKLPLDVESIGAKLVVADVAYNASRTWLTRQAAERGCRVIDGWQSTCSKRRWRFARGPASRRIRSRCVKRRRSFLGFRVRKATENTEHTEM